MRLFLKNFKKHTNLELDISDEGLLRITGKNSTGKSTIIESIVYVLYGKVKNPCNWNSKSCSVKLEYQDHVIIRTSRPNTLQVIKDGITYESDAAQSIVNELVGTSYDEFIVSSYIRQKNITSLLSMTPSEKLTVLEKLCKFDHEENQNKLRKIKECVKKYNVELYKLQSQEKVYVSEINKLQAELSTKHNLKKYKTEQLSSARSKLKKVKSSLDSLNKKQNNSTKLRSRKEKEVEEKEKLAEEYETYISTKKELDSLKLIHSQTLKKYKKHPRETITELEKIYLSKKERVTFYKSYLKYLSTKTSLENKVEELKSECGDDDENDLEDLRAKLSTTEDKLKRAKSSLDSLTFIESGMKKIFSIADNLSEYVKVPSKKNTSIIKYLSSLNSIFDNITFSTNKKYGKVKVWKCPSCECGLTFNVKENLVKVDDDNTLPTEHAQKVKKLYDEYKSIYSTLEKEVGGATTDTTSKIKKLEKEVASYQKEMDTLSENILVHKSKEYYKLQMKKKLKSVERDLTLLSPPSPPTSLSEKSVTQLDSIDEEICSKRISFLKDQLDDIAKNIDSLQPKKNKLESLEAEMLSKREYLKDITKAQIPYENINEEIVSLRKELETATKEILETTEIINEKRRIYDDLNATISYLECEEKIVNTKKSVKDVEEKIEETNEKIAGYIGLEEAFKEAEILHLQDFIDQINTSVSYYMNNIFDRQLSLRLEAKDSGVSGRPLKKLSLFIKVCYVTNKVNSEKVCVDFDELTGGGETQGCMISLLFALNDLVGSKFIFLDECYNHMDETLVKKIYKLLPEMTDNKLVILVQHDNITELPYNIDFDNVINVDDT